MEKTQEEKMGQPNMRFTDAEVDVLKTHFKDNLNLIKLLRKIFLPEYDPKAPLGLGNDLWININLENKTAEEALIHLHARNQMLAHIEGGLMFLNQLVSANPESKEEAEARKTKDSSK